MTLCLKVARGRRRPEYRRMVRRRVNSVRGYASGVGWAPAPGGESLSDREADAERHTELVVALLLEERAAVIGLAEDVDDVAGRDVDAGAGLEHERPIVVVRGGQVRAGVHRARQELG